MEREVELSQAFVKYESDELPSPADLAHAVVALTAQMEELERERELLIAENAQRAEIVRRESSRAKAAERRLTQFEALQGDMNDADFREWTRSHMPDVNELLEEWEQTGEWGWARQLTEIESQFVLASLYDAQRQLTDHPRRCDSLAPGGSLRCDLPPDHPIPHASAYGSEWNQCA